MSNQPTAQQQLDQARNQLLNAYVQREQARKQLEQIDLQIIGFTNILAGAELGQKAAAEAVPAAPPTPPFDNLNP